MYSNLPAQAIVAIATIGAALIAGLIAFVNLTLNKEQKTSEFRQAWIDALIDDLSAFFSAIDALARAKSDSTSATHLALTDEQSSTHRHVATQALYRMKIRLNPDEVDHIELLRLLAKAMDEQQVNAGNLTTDKTVAAINRAVDHARPVLKAEWKRVKSGELPFRIARNWVPLIVVIICSLFAAFLLAVKFKT